MNITWKCMKCDATGDGLNPVHDAVTCGPVHVEVPPGNYSSTPYVRVGPAIDWDNPVSWADFKKLYPPP